MSDTSTTIIAGTTATVLLAGALVAGVLLSGSPSPPEAQAMTTRQTAAWDVLNEHLRPLQAVAEMAVEVERLRQDVAHERLRLAQMVEELAQREAALAVEVERSAATRAEMLAAESDLADAPSMIRASGQMVEWARVKGTRTTARTLVEVDPVLAAEVDRLSAVEPAPVEVVP